jgi:hypothetical protein
LVALRLAYPDFDWIPVDELIDAHVDMLLHGIVCAGAEARSKNKGDTQQRPPLGQASQAGSI